MQGRNIIIRCCIITLFLGLSFFSFNNKLHADEEFIRETEGRLESAKLDEILDKYLATILMYDPERATLLGMHDNDDELTPRDFQIVSKELDALKIFIKDIEKINKDVLDFRRKNDYDLFYSILEKDIYELSNLNKLSSYPQYYLEPFDIVYFTMNKDFTDYMSRARMSLKRLSQIPDILYKAERNITRPPRVWVKYTIRRINYLLDNMSDFYSIFKGYTGLDPVLREKFDKVINSLKYSLERYRNYLENDVLKMADGKPYCGAYTYGFYLERWHKIDYNPRKALRVARKNFKKVYSSLEKEAEILNPEVYLKEGVSGVYKTVKEDYPEYDDVLKYILDEIERAKNHFDKYKVLPYPQQRLLLKELPGFISDFYPTVFYLGPFALDSNRAGEFYYYLPPKKTKDIKTILQYLYSQPKVEFYVSSLILPGLHLRYYMLGEQNKLRRIAEEPTVELGWMMYSEKLAEDMGYYNSVYTPFLIKYVEALRALRAYVDVAFHINELEWDECMELFKKYFGMDDESAERELLNISFRPTYYFAGIYGYERFEKLRKKYVSEENKFFDLREFHSDVLSIGNLPVENLEKELKYIRKKKLTKRIEEDVE